MAESDHQAQIDNAANSYGIKPTQPEVESFAGLYERAAHPESWAALDNAGQAITDVLKQRFPGQFDGVAFTAGPLKDWDRAAIKLLPHTGNVLDPENADEITDLVRGRIVIDNADQIRAIREILADEDLRNELGIVYAKDRFAVPSDTHYRDINMSIRLPGGHIAEIQINQRDMLAAAEFTHDPYEDADAIEKRAQIEQRLATSTERIEQQHLTNYAQDVHDLGAARFEGADELLNEAGRVKLERDYAMRLAADPHHIPGATVQTGHKYDAVLVDGLPPLDLSRDAYGGIGAKELHSKAGIVVDGIRSGELDYAKIGQPDTDTLARLAAERADAMRKPAFSLLEEFGKRSGVIGGVVVAGTLYASDADAGEIARGTAEAVVPGVSAALALQEGRVAEAAMRGIEEVPLIGIAASELARPLLRAAGADMDPSIGEMLLSQQADVSPEQDRFLRVFDSLPETVGDDLPPEVASLAAARNSVLACENSLYFGGLHGQVTESALDAAQDRYSGLYDEMLEHGGIEIVESWIADNPLTATKPAVAKPEQIVQPTPLFACPALR